MSSSVSASGRGARVAEGALLCLAVFAVGRLPPAVSSDPRPATIWAVVAAYLGAMILLVAGASFREGRAGARARWEVLDVRPRTVQVREALVVGVAGLAVLGLLEWAARSLAGVEVGPYRPATERQVEIVLSAIREHPWLAVGLMSTAGVVEEVVYRGWGILLVRRAMPSLAVPALLVSSLLFGAAHVVVPAAGFAHYSLLGLIFGSVALASGSVVPGALLHGAMNAVVVAVVAWGA